MPSKRTADRPWCTAATSICNGNRARCSWARCDLVWSGAGAILSPLLGERYGFIAGSLGASPTLGLGEPGPGTIEAGLQTLVDGWGMIKIADVPAGDPRTDATVEQGYFRLDRETIDHADALLHLANGSAVR